MTLKTYLILAIVAVSIVGCSPDKKESKIQAPPFPYEAYLEQTEEDQLSPKIGDDGHGFDAISNHIRYPELPAELSLSHFADSLLLMYNTCLAFNTMAYDVSTAERYMNDSTLCIEQANALDSINLSGINDNEIREALLACSKKAGLWIREGKRPNEQENKEVEKFYEVYNKFCNQFLDGHISDVEYDPTKIIENYNEIHQKAITDTLSYQYELLEQVRAEVDFQRRCVFAREFAYANFKSKERDDKELVAIIDPILRSNEYSPLLYDLWLMWRTALQKNILGSPSNDGAMYNLFYNDMRNQIAVRYIKHLKVHPYDQVAFNKFATLAMEYNITRNSPCYFGNNSMLDEMSLYDECWNNKSSENEN